MRSDHESSRSNSRSPSSGRDQLSETSHESDHEHERTGSNPTSSTNTNNRLTTGALLKAAEQTEKAEATQNETRDEANSSFSANSLLQLKKTKVNNLKEEPSTNSESQHSMLSNRNYRRSRSRERENHTNGNGNGSEQQTTQPRGGNNEEPEYRVVFHGREVLATDLIGLRVAKTFAGHGRFLGQIVRFNVPNTTYTVVYADGDAEELDVLSAIDILIQDEIERAEPLPPSKTSILLPRDEKDEEQQRQQQPHQPHQPHHPHHPQQQPPAGAPESPSSPRQRQHAPLRISAHDAKLMAEIFDSHALPLLIRQGWRVQGTSLDRFGRRFIAPDANARGGLIFASPLQVIEFIASDAELLHACFPRQIHEKILAFAQHAQSLAERRDLSQHKQIPYRKRPHIPEEDIQAKRRKELTQREEKTVAAAYMSAYRPRQNEMKEREHPHGYLGEPPSSARPPSPLRDTDDPAYGRMGGSHLKNEMKEREHPHGYRGEPPSSPRPPSPLRDMEDPAYGRLGGSHLRHGDRAMYEAEAHRYERDRSQDRGAQIRPPSAGSSVEYRERGLPSRSAGAEPLPRWGHSTSQARSESRGYSRLGPASERVEHPHVQSRYGGVDSPDWRDRYRQTATVAPPSEHSYASAGYADRSMPGHSRLGFRGPGGETPPYRGYRYPGVEDSSGRDSSIGNGPSDPYRRLPVAGGRPMYGAGVDQRHETDAPPGGHYRSNGLPERLPSRSSFAGHSNPSGVPSRPGGAFSMMDLEQNSHHRTPSMEHRMHPEELYGHRTSSANGGRELPRFQGPPGSGRPVMDMPTGRGP